MQIVTHEQVVRSFSAAHPPAARVELGETFAMETNDRFSEWQDGGAPPSDRVSVLTGPVHVEGVSPGDTLAIDLVDIEPRGDYGYLIAIPGYGLMGDEVAFERRIVSLTGDGVVLSPEFTLPLQPMIGKLGLAPAGGDLPSNASGTFGGQLGITQFGPGARLLLPVAAPGALLMLEDVHAAMGDGEATSSAVEIAATVTLRCERETEIPVARPVLVTADEIMTTGEGESLEAANRMALDGMRKLLAARCSLQTTDIALLIGAAGDFRISMTNAAPYRTRLALPRGAAGL